MLTVCRVIAGRKIGRYISWEADVVGISFPHWGPTHMAITSLMCKHLAKYSSTAAIGVPSYLRLVSKGFSIPPLCVDIFVRVDHYTHTTFARFGGQSL